MNKIICEVCGTAYQETATQCPICGCVRSAAAEDVIADSSAEAPARSYTYVKGGRFSKANVKKRNRANPAADNTVANPAAPRRRQESGNKSNSGLVIAIIILLLAIVAVVIFITVKFFWNRTPVIEEPSTEASIAETEPSEQIIPCEDLTLDVEEVFFNELGSARMIYAEVAPSDTTDTISFTSSDPSVVTVDDKGKVVAVGTGEAEIIVTCGDKTVSCRVVCEVEATTEETVPAALEEIVISAEEVRLNRKDMTLTFQGEEWILYSGSLDASTLGWSANREAYATISNGVVKAVSAGMTTVYVTYTEENITGTKSIVVNLFEEADAEFWTVTCTDSEGNEVTAPITDAKAVFANLDPSMTYTVTVKVGCIVRCDFVSSSQQGVGGHGGAGADGEG